MIFELIFSLEMECSELVVKIDSLSWLYYVAQTLQEIVVLQGICWTHLSGDAVIWFQIKKPPQT